jgi:hypothetical protein
MLRIRNWRKFQHYNKRRPDWIKLHAELLDNPEWRALDDRHKAHLSSIWLLAARLHSDPETDAEIPPDPKYLSALTGCGITDLTLESLVVAGFLDDASNMLAPCKQSASPEIRERDRVRDREEEDIYVDSVPRNATPVAMIWERHIRARARYFTEKNGQAPKPPQLTTKLRKAIRTAIKEHGEQAASDAGVGIFLDPFYTGKNDEEREWLQPAICWRINGTTDNVQKFSEIVAAKRARRESIRAQIVAVPS